MTTTATMAAIDYKAYFDVAITYDTYRKNFENEMTSEEKSPYAQYLPQNWSRQSRLDRKLKLNENLASTIHGLEKKYKWLVITEHWCGDASQINPVIHKAAEISQGKIDLRFIYRDENEALIDAHLTDGKSRSIPILIQLDEDYNVVKTYGPRPIEAQNLVMSILAEGGSYSIPVHTWYAKDKQKAIQEDLVDLLKQ